MSKKDETPEESLEQRNEEVPDEELEDASGGVLLPAVQKIRSSPKNLRPLRPVDPDSLRKLEGPDSIRK